MGGVWEGQEEERKHLEINNIFYVAYAKPVRNENNKLRINMKQSDKYKNNSNLYNCYKRNWESRITL